MYYNIRLSYTRISLVHNNCAAVLCITELLIAGEGPDLDIMDGRILSMHDLNAARPMLSREVSRPSWLYWPLRLLALYDIPAATREILRYISKIESIAAFSRTGMILSIHFLTVSSAPR